MIWQVVGLLGASVVLGFAFNTSNPVGIRFGDASSESANLTTPTSESKASSVSTDRSAILPPLPPAPVEKPAVRPEIVSAPPPAPTSSPNQVPTRHLTPAAPVAAAPVVALPTPPPTAGTPLQPPADQNPAAIHWAQAQPMVAAGQAVLVDVRAKGMYDAGHIPGALSLPETSLPEEFTAFLNQHPTNITLILYCSSTTCSQSARVAGRLVTQYQRPGVKYMTGGYLEYQQIQQAEALKHAAAGTP